jgi:RNA polymerase sigma-70 factor, ECF subfamily
MAHVGLGQRAAPAVEADVTAFEAFFHAHERSIFAYLWRMTGDEQAAYDLSQETFLRAWQRFARVAAYDKPAAWLFRVATNLALNSAQRRAIRERERDAVAPSLGGDASDPADQIAGADRTLQTLSPRRRAVLILHDAAGLATAEVAEALGMRQGAVRMALSRAREEFRLRYAREDDIV